MSRIPCKFWYYFKDELIWSAEKKIVICLLDSFYEFLLPLKIIELIYSSSVKISEIKSLRGHQSKENNKGD